MSFVDHIRSEKNIKALLNVIISNFENVDLKQVHFKLTNIILNKLQEDSTYRDMRKVKPNTKNINVFNNKVLQELFEELTGSRMSTDGMVERKMSRSGLEQRMAAEIQERNQNGMQIPGPITVSKTSSIPMTVMNSTSDELPDYTARKTTTTSVSPTTHELMSIKNEFKSAEYMIVDFRNDLLEIQNNVYTISILPEIKGRNIKLSNCQIEYSEHLKNEPILLMKISQFDGKFKTSNDNFFARLIPKRVVDNIYTYVTEPHFYYVNDKNVDTVFNISFYNDSGEPLSLSEIEIETVDKVKINYNRKEMIRTKFTTKNPHNLKKNDTLMITYANDGINVINQDVLIIENETSFILDDELDIKNTYFTINKKNIKVNISFEVSSN